MESYDLPGDLFREASHAEVDALDAVSLPRGFRHQLARAVVLPQRSWSVLLVSEGGEDAS